MCEGESMRLIPYAMLVLIFGVVDESRHVDFPGSAHGSDMADAYRWVAWRCGDRRPGTALRAAHDRLGHRRRGPGRGHPRAPPRRPPLSPRSPLRARLRGLLLPDAPGGLLRRARLGLLRPRPAQIRPES